MNPEQQLDLSTLPQRMRYAADTIEELQKLLPDIYASNASWRPSELRREADELEAEQREAAEREELVEELAREMFTEQGRLYPNHANFKAPFDEASSGSQSNCRLLAAVLIDNGWRKGDPE